MDSTAQCGLIQWGIVSQMITCIEVQCNWLTNSRWQFRQFYCNFQTVGDSNETQTSYHVRYTQTHSDRHTHTQTLRQTDRQTDRQTHKHSPTSSNAMAISPDVSKIAPTSVSPLATAKNSKELYDSLIWVLDLLTPAGRCEGSLLCSLLHPLSLYYKKIDNSKES